MTQASTCDLCGLPLLGKSIHAGDRRFCCEGCHRVWQVAQGAGIDALLDTPEARRLRSKSSSERKLLAAKAAGARRETLRVEGMWCTSCGLVLEDALMDLPGVLDAEVSYAGSMARVTWDPDTLRAEQISSRISMLGYSAHPAREILAPRSDVEDVFLRFFVSVAVGMWVMWPTLFVLYPEYAHGVFGTQSAIEGFSASLTLVVLLFGGWPFIRGAWFAAKARRATMDTLVALGTWSAWLYSVYAWRTGTGPTYFESATMITAIVLLGRWLEALGSRSATASLSQLVEGAVDEAWHVPEGAAAAQAVRVPLDEIVSGSIVVVRAGERVPADGSILEGVSDIDHSRLTGEPIPTTHAPGDEVWAGTMNLSGLLVVRVSRTGAETLAGRLSALVEDAVFAKSAAQRVADAVSRVFVPVVMGIAVGAAFVTVATGLGLSVAVSRSVAVLVVACPCALGLATPLATANAISAGTRNGLLVRGGPTLENSGKITVVAFDKTGTLTVGAPVLAGAIGIDGSAIDPAELLEIVAPLEVGDPHPVARAVLTAIDSFESVAASDVQRMPGLGVTGLLAHGVRAFAGSEALMSQYDLALPLQAKLIAEEARGTGELVIWVAAEDRIIGGLRFADRIRDDASATIEWLHAMGIKTAIVSGDAIPTCEAVAAVLGIDLVFGGILPHQKDDVIRTLAGSDTVAFVGDGVNDAAAMAAADLAIAVDGGSDVTVWAADVVLLDGNRSPLAAIPSLVMISEATRRTIRQNLAWAFSYNLLTVPLAVSGLLSPIAAAAAMALSSLAVVANSSRLSRAGRR